MVYLGLVQATVNIEAVMLHADTTLLPSFILVQKR